MKHSKVLGTMIVIALLCACLFFAAPALAEDITTWSALQTALNAGGSVTLTEDLTAGPDDTMLQVSGTVTLDLNGHTLDRNRSTADADGHVIIVNAGGNLTLKDTSLDHSGTITGGYANNGGGINNKGTLRVENVTITGNHVSGANNGGRGAGIYNNNSLDMIGCTVSGNSGDDAGGLFNDGGTVTLLNVTITGNTSTHHGGGGIVNYGMLTLSNCAVSSNTAYSNGGGIWSEATLVNLNSCTFSSNTAGDKGGALYVSSGTVCTNACAFSGNTAHDGGAIYITASGVVVNNGDPSIAGITSVTGNTATVNGGGGITNYGELCTVDILTVTDNTAAGNGGGIWVNGTFEAKGTVTVRSNKSGENDNNLYLKSGKVITLTGALDSTSEIRISAENPLTPVTSGWSERMGETAPAGCIVYDDGMTTAVLKNSEVSFRIGYVDRSWNGSAVVSENTYIPDSETPIVYNGQEELTNAWVIVSRSQTLNGRLGINGSVHLILMDGVTLTCTEGVRVAQGHTLTIYGQKNDSGKLIATGRQYTAGIGSNDQDGSGNPDSAGTINICGGTIEATGGEDGAGIGGGNEAHGGTVTVYGGTVKATGGENGAGIGGGDEGNGGTTTICGGTVTAKGRHDSTYGIGTGAGIGGGNKGNGGTITINGGTVNASTERKGAGIGCGVGSASIGSITINGGTVTAVGGGPDNDNAGGAGIGGAFDTSIASGTITINGGTVTARGGHYSAGIGGGEGSNFNAAIVITNGEVTASGGVTEGRGNSAAGIGGGAYRGGGGDFGGTLTISGGTVRAYSGFSNDSGGAGIGGGYHGDLTGTINISGGTVIAGARHGGAAIGAGERGTCTGLINITGGTLKLKTEDNSISGEAIPANVIGHGASYSDNNAQNGTLKLPDGYSVWLEDQTPAPAANRKALCQSPHESIYLYIGPCTHSDATYTCTETTHTLNCSWCLDQSETAHDFDPSTHLCTVCGYEYGGWLVTIGFDGNGGTGSMEEVQVIPHGSYRLPENGFTAPDGKRFKEWTVGTYNISVPVARAPGDLIEDITGNLVVTAIWQSIPFGTPDFTLPDSLLTIEANAFEGIAASVVDVPDGCTAIGDHAFKDCDGLTMIRIPADCTLGTDVFDGCTKVYVFSTAGSPAETYCSDPAHTNCVFVVDDGN